MNAATDDPSLLAEFLDEAGEWVEKISADLMALDAARFDAERSARLLRGFHTIKGGAGFLELEATASLCHAAEDLLSALSHRQATPNKDQLDALLASVSAIEAMLQAARRGDAAGDPALLCARLRAAAQAAQSPDPDISEAEFDAVLDQLWGAHGVPGGAAPHAPATGASPRPTPTAPPPVGAAVPPVAESGEAHAAVPDVTMRVDTRRLDRILGLVGELVLARNRLKTLHTVPASGGDPTLGELDRVVSALQAAVMQVRMQPVGKLFGRVPRMVRELANRLGRQARVELVGEDTELDKTLVDALADPLVHLVRNALDHGIEPPAARRLAGKPETGLLRLSACQQGEHVVIELSDDGAGIDPALVRDKAVEKGIVTREQAAALAPEECRALLFHPGFSTSEEVTEVSGRGVGLDVVQSRLAALGGHVELSSEPGRGTRFRLRVPLRLSILPALMADVADHALAIPLSSVCDVFPFEAGAVQRIAGQPNLVRDGNRTPLVRLRRRFAAPDVPGAALVVMLERGTRRTGVVVDRVHGREEIVVKPLGDALNGRVPFSGAAVLGDGRIALVLDPEPLLMAQVA